jgi:fibronectin type 3 domain-containing protein
MEVAQSAAMDVSSLTVAKGGDGNVTLSWIAPAYLSPINVTRYHVYRLDSVTLFWTQIAELTKQYTSYQDPVLNDGHSWQYKVTAMIK